MLGAIWGSFLNVVACRVINDQSIVTPRSRCPQCKTTIAWYDNIPILSWIILQGTCRHCNKNISWLYPCIEFLTMISLLALYNRVEPTYFIAYVIFFSVLIVSMRTDLEYMLIISELCLYPIFIAFLLSWINLLPISFAQSVLGACIGYMSLWTIAHVFFALTKKKGLGEGDFDLFALIGAFTGIEGLIFSIFIASWSGTIIGLIYLLITKQSNNTRIPFAPFLALSAMLYVLLQDDILRYFLYNA